MRKMSVADHYNQAVAGGIRRLEDHFWAWVAFRAAIPPNVKVCCDGHQFSWVDEDWLKSHSG